ncbi:MAG: class I SAM-dependent DNA methyltransferase [Thermoleophilia bacterium]|nr:class I SAM-dependent DNA methyltransferase [Thermoleophilia bacterium]
MPITGEEIRQRLSDFQQRWSDYAGSERAEAQTFLNDLFTCFGTDRQAVARFEDAQHGRFLDLIWDRVCIIEMKRPSEAHRLDQHRPQAFGYWRDAADPARNLPAPRWLVLCAFTRFEIWEPGAFPNEPLATFDISDLLDRSDSLLFLAGREPVFLTSQEAVTREAVAHVTDLYAGLRERRAADPDVLRDFVLQCVWCMFAEDLGQLERQLFTRIVDDLLANPQRSSADDLGGLFRWLNTEGARPEAGFYAETRYVNGGLFAEPSEVHLDSEELAELRAACEFDWKRVEPHIFGSLLEGALGEEAQWTLGAHYTHSADIMKVIGPSIVTPWLAKIEGAETVAQAQSLQDELLNFTVLDPACGSGNFLYIAYRELRQIERRLRERERELRQAAGMPDPEALSGFFPLHNIKGIEINAFAVALARVTLWMGHKLVVDELNLAESTLPLENLSEIRTGDALRVEWPQASVIVGNPPFHGDRNLRSLLGDAYVEWLSEEFGCGLKDHCVYWFRKAHDQLAPGQRAGLVGTNSISQNRARGASLNYIVENDGIITDAVSTQDWPGAANVDVSIVNWIKGPVAFVPARLLDEAEVEGIDTALRESTIPVADVPRLPLNRHIAFQGFLPGAHYDIEVEEARELLQRDDCDYSRVVLPYMDGRDIARNVGQQPTRYTIDFAQMTLEAAMAYPAAIEVIRAQAREARENSPSYHRNPRWWQFLWPRPDFREKLGELDRFIAGTRVSKWILFTWCDSNWRPSDSTNVFAFDSSYAMAILTSSIHTHWAKARSSTLEDRIRYTPSSAFETFPWPRVSQAQADLIGDHGQAVIERRQEICVQGNMGLTDLYNQIEDGAWDDLSTLHAQLDEAVLAAYGWNDLEVGDHPSVNQHLYELNRRITEGLVEYRGPTENLPE